MTNTPQTSNPTLDKPVKSICAYCRKEIDDDDVIERSIYSPNWKPTCKSPLRKYHKSKGCAGYDQMGHEG